jgi:hypothetical protein
MRIATLLAAVVLVAAPTWAQEQKKHVGLIAYADCAEDGKVTPADHAKCAEGKDRDDMLLVFVPEKSPKKIYELLFEDPAEDYIGKMVVVDGILEDNFLEILTIEAKK